MKARNSHTLWIAAEETAPAKSAIRIQAEDVGKRVVSAVVGVRVEARN
jgi:hypothetical protein